PASTTMDEDTGPSSEEENLALFHHKIRTEKNHQNSVVSKRKCLRGRNALSSEAVVGTRLSRAAFVDGRFTSSPRLREGMREHPVPSLVIFLSLSLSFFLYAASSDHCLLFGAVFLRRRQTAADSGVFGRQRINLGSRWSSGCVWNYAPAATAAGLLCTRMV
ncbi:hypothetical protein HPB47_013106, partial [Ixodes persulcatus]